MKKKGYNKEIGAFVYQIKRGRVYLVLVTNRTRSRWILPKGQPEFRLSDKKVALLEAYEEAGVRGKLNRAIKRVDVEIRTGNGNVRLKVYPVKLKKLMTDWPERRYRNRQLLPADQAIKLVQAKEFQGCIRSLSERVLAGVAK